MVEDRYFLSQKVAAQLLIQVESLHYPVTNLQAAAKASFQSLHLVVGDMISYRTWHPPIYRLAGILLSLPLQY